MVLSRFWKFLPASKKKVSLRGISLSFQTSAGIVAVQFQSCRKQHWCKQGDVMGVFFTPHLEKHLGKGACEVWANPILPSSSFDILFLLVAQEQVGWNLLCVGVGLGTFQSAYSVAFSIFSCLSFFIEKYVNSSSNIIQWFPCPSGFTVLPFF